MAELGIDFGVSAVMLVLGVLLVWRVGLGRWRRTGARRCLGCGYDMRGSEGLVCAECGYGAKSEREVEHGRVRWRWLVLGVLLCMPGVWLVGFWVWYPWKAIPRRAAEARFGQNFKIKDGPVELQLNYGGSRREAGSDPFAPNQGWDAFLLGLMMDEKSRSFCGMQTMYFSAENMSPTLDGSGGAMTGGDTYWRRVMVYVAHLMVFPVRHYGEYLPYEPIDTFVIEGTGGDVIPKRVYEEAAAFDGIKDIALIEVKVDDGVIDWVAGHWGLKTVYIHGLDASAGTMAGLGGLKELEDVALYYKREITPEDFAWFSRMEGLKWLEISGVKGAGGDFDRVMAGVVEANRLETLKFDYPLISDGGKSGKPWPALKTPGAIGRCKSLKLLEADMSGWTQEQMVPLGDLALLKTLTLTCEGGRKLESPKALAWLEMTPITTLTLKGFTGTDLAFLFEMWMLGSLHLCDVPMDAPVLRRLEGLKLQNLTLENTGLSNVELNSFGFPRTLESVEISGWIPSDEACGRLAKLSGFWQLSADDVSAEGLKILAGTGRRREVKLRASRLTKEQVDEARKMNPDLKVEVIEVR